jgi:hypothetical protein
MNVSWPYTEEGVLQGILPNFSLVQEELFTMRNKRYEKGGRKNIMSLDNYPACQNTESIDQDDELEK